MPFVMFTLALVLNCHVHLISVADELGGLDWRRHSARAKSQDEEFQDEQMHSLFYPEDLVQPVCQHD